MLLGADSEHYQNKEEQTGYRPANAALIALKAIYQEKPNTQPDANPGNEIVNGNSNEVSKLYAENLILAFLYGALLSGIIALLLFIRHQRNCNTKSLDRTNKM